MTIDPALQRDSRRNGRPAIADWPSTGSRNCPTTSTLGTISGRRFVHDTMVGESEHGPGWRRLGEPQCVSVYSFARGMR
jgi:hypothetical protein